MKHWLQKLISEQGDVSTMRVMSLASLATGIGLAIAGLCVGRELTGLAALCGVFVTAAFAGKAWQKSQEK